MVVKKWVDYACSFWHVDCVRKNWAKKPLQKANEAFCKESIIITTRKISQPYYLRNPKQTCCSVPKGKNLTNSLFSKAFNSCVWHRNTSKSFVKNEWACFYTARIRTVMSMYSVGETYGPQLIAEIGDVSRFTHREAITAFASVDPGVNESGQFKQRSNHASKNGSTRL